MLCVSYRGNVFEAFYDRNEDPYQQMDNDGKREFLGMIGKSAVRKILIELNFSVNGISNAGQSCQVNSGVITYTSLENQALSVKMNSTFEN